MTAPVDLSESSPTAALDRLATALDTLAVADKLDILANEDPAIYLNQYRIATEDRDLEWEYETSGPESWQVTVRIVEADESLPVFDVRDLRPQRRHDVLLETFDALDPGQGFVLVNDHDPKPLGHELRSTRGETFDWTYHEQTSGEWRVAIEKTKPSTPAEHDVTARFDVREIPQEERHETIHHRYGMIPEGATMEILAPHNPRPLHHEFEAKYGDSFTWEIVDEQPDTVRVQVTKGRDEAKESTEDSSTGETEGELTVTQELDVRDRPPAQRHEAIFETYADLEHGEGFVLVNDHDPKPLYHQFEAEASDAFVWTYRRKEPGEFRVFIGKAEAADTRENERTDLDAPF